MDLMKMEGHFIANHNSNVKVNIDLLNMIRYLLCVYKLYILTKNNVPKHIWYLNYSIPGSWRSPRGGHGNPLQYFCLENPMDRETWPTRVHRVAKNRTQLKRLSKHALSQDKIFSSLFNHSFSSQRRHTIVYIFYGIHSYNFYGIHSYNSFTITSFLRQREYFPKYDKIWFLLWLIYIDF